MTYRNQGIYSVIADPHRRQIIDILAGGDKSAGEIAQQFEISRPAIVKHLRVLEEHGLVEIQKIGRERKHHLTPRPLREVHDWLNRYETFWKDRLQSLKHIVESKSSAPQK